MSRQLSAEDLYAIKVVDDPRISPDGTRIAYVLVEMDRTTFEYQRTIWVVPSAWGEPRRFSTGPNDIAPRWSPDGRTLAFVRAPTGDAKAANKAERERGIGRPQIWLMPTDGGEALKLTWARDGASNPIWSPDGKTIVFSGTTGEQDDPEADAAELEGRNIPRVRTITQLYYRFDGAGYIYDQHSHLFSIAADGAGEARQLTRGDFDDGEAAWSPDGTRLAFASDRSEQRWRWPGAAVWVLELASGGLTRLTDESLACSAPAWSPDSTTIAFLAQPRRHGVGHTDLYTVPAAGTETQRLLTQDFVPACADMCLDDMRMAHAAARLIWSADGHEIFFLASMRGTTHIYAAHPAGDLLPRRLTDGDCRIYHFALDKATQTLALALATPAIPGDLFVKPVPPASSANPTAAQRLTSVNAALLGEVELIAPQKFAFRGADGWELEGWTIRPPQVGAGEAVSVPAVLEVHGGPAYMYGSSFMFEFQLLAANGYAVVYSNPRGSTGYGRIFSGAIINDWGGKDFEDVMAGLDAAIAAGGIDSQRVGVAGGSYGGYMTNWAIGHTDRFKAAVSMRSVTNMATMFGTSDLGWGLVVDELSVVPWEDPERAAHFSPITYVERIHTPLLILHSEEDLRCPISEAEQLFSALAYLGREVELVRFAGQSHDLSRGGHPRSRVIRLQKILGWFQKHMPTGSAPAPHG